MRVDEAGPSRNLINTGCQPTKISAHAQLQCNAAGQVVLKLKTPWRDGTTHLVMGPLEFMLRLAAPLPRKRAVIPS